MKACSLLHSGSFLIFLLLLLLVLIISNVIWDTLLPVYFVSFQLVFEACILAELELRPKIIQYLSHPDGPIVLNCGD